MLYTNIQITQEKRFCDSQVLSEPVTYLLQWKRGDEKPTNDIMSRNPRSRSVSGNYLVTVVKNYVHGHSTVARKETVTTQKCQKSCKKMFLRLISLSNGMICN